MKYSAVIFWSIATTTFATGHGSSGGGQSRAEHFKSIGDQLVQFQKDYSLLARANLDHIHDADKKYLDSVAPEQLAKLIQETTVQFLGEEDQKISERFAWINHNLIDRQTNQSDLEGIYVADLKQIFVDPKKWDNADEQGRYFLVRKEYWRGFSKENESGMRLYIKWYFDDKKNAPKEVEKAQPLDRSIRCIGPSSHSLLLQREMNGAYKLDLNLRANNMEQHFNLSFPAGRCFYRLKQKDERNDNKPVGGNFLAQIKCWGADTTDERTLFSTELTEKIADIEIPTHGFWEFSRREMRVELHLANLQSGAPDTHVVSGDFQFCQWHTAQSVPPWERPYPWEK